MYMYMYMYVCMYVCMHQGYIYDKLITRCMERLSSQLGRELEVLLPDLKKKLTKEMDGIVQQQRKKKWTWQLVIKLFWRRSGDSETITL